MEVIHWHVRKFRLYRQNRSDNRELAIVTINASIELLTSPIAVTVIFAADVSVQPAWELSVLGFEAKLTRFSGYDRDWRRHKPNSKPQQIILQQESVEEAV